MYFSVSTLPITSEKLRGCEKINLFKIFFNAIIN